MTLQGASPWLSRLLHRVLQHVWAGALAVDPHRAVVCLHLVVRRRAVIRLRRSRHSLTAATDLMLPLVPGRRNRPSHAKWPGTGTSRPIMSDSRNRQVSISLMFDYA